MRKVALTLASALAVAAVAAPAQAVSITFAQNSTAAPNNENWEQDFSSFAVGTVFSGGSVVSNGSQANVTSAPSGVTAANGNYLTVLGGTSYTYNFMAHVPVLSLIVGSLDSYNSVTLNFVSAPSQTFTGSQLGTLGEDGLITFDVGGNLADQITGFVLNSGSNSFEVSRIATAAPEPATWGMMILGFGIAGTSLRARRRQNKLATA